MLWNLENWELKATEHKQDCPIELQFAFANESTLVAILDELA